MRRVDVRRYGFGGLTIHPWAFLAALIISIAGIAILMAIFTHRTSAQRSDLIKALKALRGQK